MAGVKKTSAGRRKQKRRTSSTQRPTIRAYNELVHQLADARRKLWQSNVMLAAMLARVDGRATIPDGEVNAIQDPITITREWHGDHTGGSHVVTLVVDGRDVDPEAVISTDEAP